MWEGTSISIFISAVAFGFGLSLAILGNHLPPLTSSGLIYFMLDALGISLAGRLASFYSIKAIGAARASQLSATQPFFTLLFALVFLKETLAPKQYVGIFLVTLGVYLLGGEILRHADPSDGPGGNGAMGGILLGLFSGFAYSVGNIFRKMGLAAIPSPLVGAFVSSFFSALILVGYFYWRRGATGIRQVARYPRPALFGYALAGLFTTASWWCNFTALLYLPVSVLAALKSASPLVVMILSLIFLPREEKINRRVVASGLIVVAGIGLAL